MASGQNEEEFSVKAGQNVGQAQVKRDDWKVDNNTNSSQTSGFFQQKGEKVKSMAQGASEAVKNKLGMNSDKDNDYKNKNPLGRKNPNNTTCPSMPEDHYCRISSDTSTTTFTACINSTYNASVHLSVEGFPQSMEFFETFQFVCQRSAAGDGRICCGTVLGCPVQAESEPCVLSEGLAQAVPKVEGNAPGWFHRAAITSLFRQWTDHGSTSLSEGLAQAVPKVEGNALGWFHRAAITSHFRQWTDHGSTSLRREGLSGEESACELS
uniref:Uncharacterized protein n=1 Tax=Brassica oleracea var. oleracea TaxID=109376 RepID=A0A0D3DPT2_BRAOL